jgi:hypothetical protein
MLSRMPADKYPMRTSRTLASMVLAGVRLQLEPLTKGTSGSLADTGEPLLIGLTSRRDRPSHRPECHHSQSQELCKLLKASD